MAATHHGFNIVKIPSANGTITVRCNDKDALRSVEHVYREAATMIPADEDLLEHLGDLVRKKQLVSQERVAAKKVALRLISPGPSYDGHEHWGSCDTLKEVAAVHSRALKYKEGSFKVSELQEFPHHQG
jgi:hypothetical protein